MSKKLSLVKKERMVFLAVFVIAASVLALDRLTPMEISNSIILFVLVFTTLSSMFLMICQYLFGELSTRFVAMLFLLIFGICLGMAMLSWKSDWKTQAILYRNKKNNRQTIEYRMRTNRFGPGFEKQLIRRTKILPFLESVHFEDTISVDSATWNRVNEKVNEMGFPGEYIDLPSK
ncbi:hypothetical protein [Flavobacterium sp. BFFFF1]|uniref:hypothetical protein n=1 Tax=Flavobacterium sp. BFFFF1 TaxID=2015557 RepID=UPI0025B868E0|nr:hypothetical protein [Flavobacterium sp. BFFFF1]